MKTIIAALLGPKSRV